MGPEPYRLPEHLVDFWKGSKRSDRPAFTRMGMHFDSFTVRGCGAACLLARQPADSDLGDPLATFGVGWALMLGLVTP